MYHSKNFHNRFHLIYSKGPSINDIGNFSEFLKPPSLISEVFLVLSVGNFDRFLTPPNCRRRLWTAPKSSKKD